MTNHTRSGNNATTPKGVWHVTVLLTRSEAGRNASACFLKINLSLILQEDSHFINPEISKLLSEGVVVGSTSPLLSKSENNQIRRMVFDYFPTK